MHISVKGQHAIIPIRRVRRAWRASAESGRAPADPAAPHRAQGPEVSRVAGTVPSVINNGAQLWTYPAVKFWRVGMNFVVPYGVTRYAAARNEAQREQGG